MRRWRQDRLEAEIERVYRARFAIFVRTASAITGDVETGRDVVQEGFARALRASDRYRGRGPLEAWIWKVVVNVAREQRRRPRPTLPLPADCDEPGAEPVDESLRLHVAALPERQRLALFLRYYADLDYDQIAAVLDVAPGTVAATLNAARAALRRRLTEVNA